MLYFERSLPGENFRTNVNRVLFSVLLIGGISLRVANANFTREQQYKQLHSELEVLINKAFDKQAELILFMEKGAVDNADYKKAEEYKKMRMNRENWKIDFSSDFR